jgi:RNA polymerase sporulation-specific sigma factor
MSHPQQLPELGPELAPIPSHDPSAELHVVPFDDMTLEAPVFDDRAPVVLPPELTEQTYFKADVLKIGRARTDELSFERLLAECRDIVHGVRRTYFLPGAEHQDLRQEAQIGFFKAVRDYDGRTPFRSFAALCVARQVITAVKASTRQKHAPLNGYVRFGQADESDGNDTSGTVDLERSDAFIDLSAPPEQQVISREGLTYLAQVVMTNLSPMEHFVLAGHVNGDSYDTIARNHPKDISRKTVDNALQRVKRKLREHPQIAEIYNL